MHELSRIRLLNKIKPAVAFWVTVPCSMVNRYQHPDGT
jgi:hypothetical protein